MQDAIKAAINDSMTEDRTVICEIDRGDIDNADLAGEAHAIWADMSDDLGDTDWDADKDGGVRIWGWVGGASAECTWTIIIR